MSWIYNVVSGAECKFADRNFLIRVLDKEGVKLLQVGMCLPCAYGGTGVEYQWGGKYYLSPHATQGEVVQKILMACIAFVEHEVRENFKYNNKRIFHPHIPLLKLCERAEQAERRGEI